MMSATVTTATVTTPGVSRSRLWFGLLGGAIAWFVHLFGASIISEWGCLSGLHQHELAGVNAVAWTLIALSAIMTIVAVAAAISAFQVNRQYNHAAEGGADESDEHGTEVYMARVGVWSSALFVFIILAESLPILYFLAEC
jgi:heme/copper-type cytochrome/quinol oxidase subunit 2